MKKLATFIAFYFGFVLFALGQTPLPVNEIPTISLLIEYPNNGSGSGLFINDSNYVYLLTARHVLLKPREVNKNIEYYWPEKTFTVKGYYTQSYLSDPFNITIDIEEAIKTRNLKFFDNRDMLLIRISKLSKPDKPNDIFQDFQNMPFVTVNTKNFEARTVSIARDAYKFEDVAITHRMYILGYPKSLGLVGSEKYDSNRPLLRGGVVAAKDIKYGTIIVDCPAYPGNSGGPAMDVNGSTAKLIGIVSQFIPYQDTWVNRQYNITNTSLVNSGYTVLEPVDYIFQLINEFKK